jgi:hypothetical protein
LYYSTSLENLCNINNLVTGCLFSLNVVVNNPPLAYIFVTPHIPFHFCHGLVVSVLITEVEVFSLLLTPGRKVHQTRADGASQSTARSTTDRDCVCSSQNRYFQCDETGSSSSPARDGGQRSTRRGMVGSRYPEYQEVCLPLTFSLV